MVMEILVRYVLPVIAFAITVSLISYIVKTLVLPPTLVVKPRPACKVAAEPKTYGKKELLRDLLDPTLTLQEVMAKCSGMSPEEIEEVAKSITSGDKRKAERLAWYAMMLRQNAALKLVPPPVRPVVVHGRMEICRKCVPLHRMPGPVLGSMSMDGYDDRTKCTACNGTGYVVLHGGHGK